MYDTAYFSEMFPGAEAWESIIPNEYWVKIKKDIDPHWRLGGMVTLNRKRWDVTDSFVSEHDIVYRLADRGESLLPHGTVQHNSMYRVEVNDAGK